MLKMKVNLNGQKWYLFSKLKDRGKKFIFTVYTSYTTYLLVHRGLQFSRWAVKLIEMSMYPVVSIIDLSLVLIWSTDWPHCPINETKTIFKGSSSMRSCLCILFQFGTQSTYHYWFLNLNFCNWLTLDEIKLKFWVS